MGLKGGGRVDVNGKWESIEKEWRDLCEHRATKAGLSVTRIVTAKDEWCAEAYMETDYSTPTAEDFIETMKSYAAYLMQAER